jgi:SSS family solute:Na+ symporter
MNIPLLIVMIYLLALAAISWWSRHRVQNADALLFAGRDFGPPLVAVSLVGLAIGGAATIGVAERAYTVGLSAGWYNVGWSVAAVAMAFGAVQHYRRLGVSTVPELFGRLFDAKTRRLCAACQLGLLLVITALQYKAGGAILASMLPAIFNYPGAVATSGVVFILLTGLGGMLSAGLSNFINVALIFAGLILASVLVVLGHGGPAAISARLPGSSDYLNPLAGAPLLVLLTPVFVMLVTQFSTQAPLQIAFAARDGHAARRGFLLAALLILPSGFMAAAVGITARGAFPDIEPAQALPQAVLGLNPWIAGLVLAALWAADVSTAVGLLLGCSAMARQELLPGYPADAGAVKRGLRQTRGIVLAFGALSLLFALTLDDRIITTLLFYATIMTAFTVSFLFAIYAPRWARRDSAFCALLACLAVLLAWRLFPAVRMAAHPIYLAAPASIIAFLLPALLGRSQPLNPIDPA